MSRTSASRTESKSRVPHDEGLLLVEVGPSMTESLNHGNGVVCIATAKHRRQFEQHLKSHGIDVVGALMREQLVCLNALDTLTKVMVDGQPDVVRFAEVIGAPVDRVATLYPRVAIFAELASLLRADDPGAVNLDALWESFVGSRPVFFRCPEQSAIRR